MRSKCFVDVLVLFDKDISASRICQWTCSGSQVEIAGRREHHLDLDSHRHDLKN